MPPIFRNAGLNKVHGLRCQKTFKVHKSERVFSRSDRYAAPSAKLCETIVVFWWPKRLLQPLQSDFLQIFCLGSCFEQSPGTIHIEGYLNVGASLVPSGPNRQQLDFVKLKDMKSRVNCTTNVCSHEARIGVTSRLA